MASTAGSTAAQPGVGELCRSVREHKCSHGVRHVFFVSLGPLGHGLDLCRTHSPFGRVGTVLGVGFGDGLDQRHDEVFVLSRPLGVDNQTVKRGVAQLAHVTGGGDGFAVAFDFNAACITISFKSACSSKFGTGYAVGEEYPLALNTISLYTTTLLLANKLTVFEFAMVLLVALIG